MRPALTRVIAIATTGLLAFALAACGGSSSKSSTSANGGEFAPPTPSNSQKKGGTLTVLSNEGFEHLDPGSSYFQVDYEIVYATQRPLYSFKPQDPKNVVPDLATGKPAISADQKTVTIKIRPGIKYSPGTVNRTATTKDVKYAIERAFSPAVANGYAPSYFNNIIGADKAKGGPIAGIETPDDLTIVFKLSKPFGATFAQALSLPASAPVPKEYVQKFDAKAPSKYDTDPTIQAFTGPYVIKSYAPGKSLSLARNPNWDPKTDFRPAYVDALNWTIGVDPNVMGRQILQGSAVISGDTPAAPIVKLGVTKYKAQINFTSSGNRYVALNTTLPPFNDPNVRKAVGAALDRTTMQRTRGGALAGDIATHLLPPTAPGFDSAGGTKPAGDWLAKPGGDMKLAQAYLKKAGFASGRFKGAPIFMVGTSEDPAIKTAQVVLDALRKLGFNVNFRPVPQQTMYSRFCNVPKSKVQVCSNVGWLPDFPDGYAYLYPVASGKAIAPLNNVNQAQLNDPAINAAIDKATAESDPAKRAAEWGNVDKEITQTAAYIPWFWDHQPNVQAKNVHGVIAQWNASYDMSFTSIN